MSDSYERAIEMELSNYLEEIDRLKAERDKYRELLEQVVCAGNANLVCASVRQPLLKKIDQALKEERDV